MERTLRFETMIPHPPERVWRALTDPEAIAEWLMENDFQPRVGHRFQLRDKPRRGWDGVVNCEVLQVDPPRCLAYSWQSNAIDTIVRFTLEPAAAGTRLCLEHSGFKGMKGAVVSFILGGGWKSKVLRRLAEVIARMARMDREGPAQRPHERLGREVSGR